MKKRFLPLSVRAAGFIICGALMALHYSAPMRSIRALPDAIHVRPQMADTTLPDLDGMQWLSSGAVDVPVSYSTDQRLEDIAGAGDSTVISYRLFGAIPLKSVTVKKTDAVMLIPGGYAVGITIRTRGVLVVGIGTVDTEQGSLSPGSTAGLRAGDVILSVNGAAVQNAAHLSELTDAAEGEITLAVEREGELISLQLLPVVDASDHVRRIGLWVRDSTAGIGTTSFYDGSAGWFCALGHPVSDIDTQSLLTIREGRIVSTQIVDIRRGEQGNPGELIGVFSIAEKPVGTILVNSEYGIYGKMHVAPENPLYGEIPMAYAYEAHTGSAKMLATVSDAGLQAFDCEVVRVNTQENAAVKGMIINITDEKLMSLTGGIVQGMSGCPVVQDGKLIGIVTHVFVNDPTRGYCVYAEWMYEQMRAAAG